MKKIFFLTVCCVMAALASNAQLKETFDSNSWQWSEYSTQLGKAYIIDGVMRLESKSDKTDVTYADMVGNVAIFI